MRRRVSGCFGSTFALLLVFLSQPIFAETISEKGDWGLLGSYPNYYNSDTVDIFSGEIEEITKIITGRCLNCYSIAIDMKYQGQIHTVYLGPAKYIKKRNFKCSPGDQITITGSLVTINGRELILAQEVTTEANLLELRDNRGHLLLKSGKNRDRRLALRNPGKAAATVSEVIQEDLERAIP